MERSYNNRQLDDIDIMFEGFDKVEGFNKVNVTFDGDKTITVKHVEKEQLEEVDQSIHFEPNLEQQKKRLISDVRRLNRRMITSTRRREKMIDALNLSTQQLYESYKAAKEARNRLHEIVRRSEILCKELQMDMFRHLNYV